MGLGVCYDEVETEVDAPEGEEETCDGKSACVRGREEIVAGVSREP